MTLTKSKNKVPSFELIFLGNDILTPNSSLFKSSADIPVPAKNTALSTGLLKASKFDFEENSSYYLLILHLRTLESSLPIMKHDNFLCTNSILFDFTTILP